MNRTTLTAGLWRSGLALVTLAAALSWGYAHYANHASSDPPKPENRLTRADRSAAATDSAPTDASTSPSAGSGSVQKPALRSVSTRSLREIGMGQLALARDLLAAGEYENAIEAYRTAVELYPSAETHAALGGLYFKLAARSFAYVEFRKAVELDPYNADLWIDLANAEHLRTAIGRSWYAIKKAREAEPGIRIVQTQSGFYERDASDPNFHTSRGSYTQRRIP